MPLTAPANLSISGLRILWADPAEMVARLVVRMFRLIGAEGDYATTAESTIEKLARNPFDLAVIDYHLIRRCEAAHLLTDLFRAAPGLPFGLTGSSIPPSTALIQPLDRALFKLEKPFSVRDLSAGIEKAIRLSRPE